MIRVLISIQNDNELIENTDFYPEEIGIIQAISLSAARAFLAFHKNPVEIWAETGFKKINKQKTDCPFFK